MNPVFGTRLSLTLAVFFLCWGLMLEEIEIGLEHYHLKAPRLIQLAVQGQEAALDHSKRLAYLPSIPDGEKLKITYAVAGGGILLDRGRRLPSESLLSRKLLLRGLIFKAERTRQHWRLVETGLPLIDLQSGPIADEPKVKARLRLLDGKGNQAWQAVTIEKRGKRLQSYPKSSWAFEFTKRDSSGTRRRPLLGMPTRREWILDSSWQDPSLLRSALAFKLAKALGLTAPQSKPVEVVLNGRYQGLYRLGEKIDGRLVGFQSTPGVLIKSAATSPRTRFESVTDTAGRKDFEVKWPKKNTAQAEQQLTELLRQAVNGNLANFDSDKLAAYQAWLLATGAFDNMVNNYYLMMPQASKASLLPWDTVRSFGLDDQETRPDQWSGLFKKAAAQPTRKQRLQKLWTKWRAEFLKAEWLKEQMDQEHALLHDSRAYRRDTRRWRRSCSRYQPPKVASSAWKGRWQRSRAWLDRRLRLNNRMAHLGFALFPSWMTKRWTSHADLKPWFEKRQKRVGEMLGE